MFYLCTILGGGLLIAVGNLALADFDLSRLGIIALGVAVGIVAIIALDGLVALAIRRLMPKAWFAADRRAFTVSKSERDAYVKLKIKSWKDLVPELGLFTGFSKSDLKNTNDSAYLARFLLESNYGVVIHLVNALLGFFILFIPLCAAPTIWIPIFIVNFVLSLLPVAILRYTAYTLQRLYRRTQKKTQADH